jgi:hypothetical protein
MITANEARELATARLTAVAAARAMTEASMRERAMKNVIKGCEDKIRAQIDAFPEYRTAMVYADYYPEVVTALRDAGYEVAVDEGNDDGNCYMIVW